MLSPARSLVSGQAARGTMAPLMATAMPRWRVSTAFSWRRAASVATMSGSGSPLTRMFASAAASLIVFSSFRGGRKRTKPLDAERADRRVHHAVEREARDRVGSDGRQQNAIAVMPGGVDEAIERSGAEDRRVVTAAGAVPDPHLIDRQLLDSGDRAPGRFEQAQNGAGGERGVIAFFFDRRSHQQAAVPARYEIGAWRPKHVAQERRGWIHTERQHLPFDRPHRGPQCRFQAFDAARPGAGGEHDLVGSDFGPIRENDALGMPAAG